jgi:hypothetical protein
MDTSCFEIRESDGYVNATKLAQAAGKLWAHYKTNMSSRTFLNKLALKIQIPVAQLVLNQRGGSRYNQGTWVHPYVATHFATWVSSDFAVCVSGWIEEAKANDPRIAQEYVTAMLNLTADENATPESIIRDALAQELDGETEVSCTHGYIDVLTSDELIEVKHVSRYTHAFGQILAYSKSFPTKKLRIHLFGTAEELKPELIDRCKALCDEYKINVTHETLTLV